MNAACAHHLTLACKRLIWLPCLPQVLRRMIGTDAFQETPFVEVPEQLPNLAAMHARRSRGA